jgi:hypothetical protein
MLNSVILVFANKQDMVRQQYVVWETSCLLSNKLAYMVNSHFGCIILSITIGAVWICSFWRNWNLLNKVVYLA